jgi:RNA polymerase sigma-70 factor (ECF subfamily)
MHSSTRTDAVSGQTDLELVRRAVAGDQDARSALAQRLACVHRMVRAITRRRQFRLEDADLEDLAQDVLLSIFRKLETFRGHTTLEAWIHRFCHLEILSRVRDLDRRASFFGSTLSVEPATELDPVEDPVVEQLLESMNPHESEVIRLHVFEDLSFDDIARLLGVPVGTAKSRYYRGIEYLQARLRSSGKDR